MTRRPPWNSLELCVHLAEVVESPSWLDGTSPAQRRAARTAADSLRSNMAAAGLELSAPAVHALLVGAQLQASMGPAGLPDAVASLLAGTVDRSVDARALVVASFLAADVLAGVSS